MKTTEAYIKITPYFVSEVKDCSTLKQYLAKNPTPVQILVIYYLDYLQYIDACNLGLGGVFAPGLQIIQPWVWQFECPT